MAIRRSNRRREFQDLCREGPRPHASSRRHRDHGQSRQSQSQSSTPAHSRGRGQALLPAEILAGPEPDRASLRQDQALLAQGRRALRRDHLHCDWRNPRSIYAKRMRQLFSKLRLCANLKASRSRGEIEPPEGAWHSPVPIWTGRTTAALKVGAWWSRKDSNLCPRELLRGALPSKLQPQIRHYRPQASQYSRTSRKAIANGTVGVGGRARRGSLRLVTKRLFNTV